MRDAARDSCECESWFENATEELRDRTPTNRPDHRGWTIATALLVVCARTIDWRRAADALVVARPTWLALAIAGNAGILMCWAAFWRTLLPGASATVPYRRMMEIVSTTSSLMNTVPFGGGHASSVMLLVRRGGVGRRAALSVLALDQLGEGLVKITLFLLVAALVPLPTWMRAGVTTASLVVAIWFVTLLIASRWTVELEPLRRRGEDARRGRSPASSR